MKAMNLSKEQRLQVTQRIRTYFEDEHGQEMGQIAADQLLDFMLKEISPYIYNQAVEEAITMVQQRMISLEEDLYALKKHIT